MVLSPLSPLPTKLACCPFSFPPMFTRSMITPGTVRSMAQGSRAFGMFAISSLVIVVAVPTFFTSTMGASAVMVTVSSTVATFIWKVRLRLAPTFTVTSRACPAKPVRPVLTVYLPWSTLRKRNSPWPPVVEVRHREERGGGARPGLLLSQAPLVHRGHDQLEAFPERRERVLGLPVGASAHLSAHESVALHVCESLAQGLLADPVDQAHELAERPRAPEEVPHDHRLMTIAQEVQGDFEGAPAGGRGGHEVRGVRRSNVEATGSVTAGFARGPARRGRAFLGGAERRGGV